MILLSLVLLYLRRCFMMNVVFYGRYSDSGQSEQSIEGQRRVFYEFAERNGYRIIAEYIDRVTSGTNADNRPEFQRMIADSAKRQFQGILVYQLDRFARNKYDSATYKTRLKKNGVKVLSARENITDDASGVLMESVLEGVAEYFSAELCIRRILTNRKYLGIYIYNDIEVVGGIPQIIDDITFQQAQILLEKNKKAPARTKAVEEHYLLTTKLFCGHCECAMTGMSGKSKTGKIHQYYSCVTQRKHGDCNKKNVQKIYIENAVIDGVLSILIPHNFVRYLITYVEH